MPGPPRFLPQAMQSGLFRFTGVPVVPGAADVQGDLVAGSHVEHFLLNVRFAQIGNRFLARQRFAAQQGQDLLHRIAAAGGVNDEGLEILGGKEVLADVLLDGRGNTAAGRPVVLDMEGALGRILEIPNVQNGVAVEIVPSACSSIRDRNAACKVFHTAIRSRPIPSRALHSGAVIIRSRSS